MKVARVNDRPFQLLASPLGIGGGGGGPSPLTTKGDIWGYSTVDARIAVGLNGYVLTADSTASLGLAWKPAASGSGTVTTVKDEGSTLSSAVVSLDFVGAGVTATGTTAVTVTIPGGGSSGWPMLEAHTASASATLDFTSFISSTYDDYVIEFVQVIPATTDTQFVMRMGTGGGPTWDTGNNYGWAVLIFRAGGSAVTGAESGSNAISLNYGGGGTLGVSSSANWGYTGTMRFMGPGTAIYKRVVFDASHLDAEPFRIRVVGEGSYESATAVTGLRFFFSGGNIASGIIRIYGIPKT